MSARGVIAPISTHYNGVTYRSRTEARWAVFFKEIGASATYEPETFSIDGSWYLPDFYSEAWNLYIEIKGAEPTPYEREKCRKLCDLTGRVVILARGAPGAHKVELFFSPAHGIGDGSLRIWARFAKCKGCPGVLLDYWSEEGFPCGSYLLGSHSNFDACGVEYGGADPKEAIARSRNERFGVYTSEAA